MSISYFISVEDSVSFIETIN